MVVSFIRRETLEAREVGKAGFWQGSVYEFSRLSCLSDFLILILEVTFQVSLTKTANEQQTKEITMGEV